jgi:glycerol uptake facilitator-like aquaporin
MGSILESLYMVVSGMLVQPARNRAIKQASLAREILNAVCLLIIGCVLYTSDEAGNPYRQDGANILGYLVPTVIHLMMENHNQLWGDACYPVVD